MTMLRFRPVLSSIWLVTAVAAGGVMPEVTISMSAGDSSDSKLGGLEPVLRWKSSGQVGAFAVEGGVTLKIEDVDSMPYRLWGKAKRSIGRWKLSGLVDTNSKNLHSWGVDLQAVGGSTAIQLLGAADTSSRGVAVSNVKLSQKLVGLGGMWTLVPRYHVASRNADLRVAYAFEDTVIFIDASGSKQKVTIRQRVGDSAIAPSVTTAGDVELEFRKMIANGAMTANFKPNDSFSLQWEDGPWQASFKAPMESFYKFTDGVKVNIRRTVDINMD